MKHWLVAGVLAAAMSGVGASAQDAPPAAAAPKSSEAKDLLKKGLETSATAGGFTFTGSVDQDSPFGGVMIVGAGLSVGPEGKCAGTVGSDGITHVRVEKDKNAYEFFRKGSKTVHRQVWTGSQSPSGSLAAEAMGALDLARLAKMAAKLKEVKKEEGTKKVGDVECVTLKVSFPSDIVEEETETKDAAGVTMKMFELKRVEATLHFGKDDNLLRKAEFKFVKGFSSMIRMGAG
ncbi:MAG TPA: hypothetical protein VK661_12055, partial [Planctomycetota bacterium]|nr:hypothetical protein [Planctomycetota bacterium]